MTVLEKILDKQYKDLVKNFRLEMGNKEHIQIAQLMADVLDKEKKKPTKKNQEEIASLQSKVVYLIKECK